MTIVTRLQAADRQRLNQIKAIAIKPVGSSVCIIMRSLGTFEAHLHEGLEYSG